MASHFDDILLKIASGELSVVDKLDHAQTFGRDVGLEEGPDRVRMKDIYYVYVKWCEKKGERPIEDKKFYKSFKFKKLHSPKGAYWLIKDIFNFTEEEKEEIVRWRANWERSKRYLKKQKEGRKQHLLNLKKERQKKARKEYRRQWLKNRRAKEALGKNLELPEESLIAILDLKNTTSQE